MTTPRQARWAGGAFALLVIGSFVVGANTEFMPRTDDIVAFYESAPVRIMISGYLLILACAALIWFVASLGAAIDLLTGERTLAIVSVAGGIVAASMLIVGGVVTLAAAERAWVTGSVDPGAATFAFDVSGVAMGNGSAVGLALLLVAAGLAARRTAQLPLWFGLASVVIGVGLLTPYGWALLLLAILWVPAAGQALSRISDRVPTPTVPWVSRP